MDKVYFEIYDFPKLAEHIKICYSSFFISDALVAIGYKSAGFDAKLNTWFIDEAEYTWLVLRWA